LDIKGKWLANYRPPLWTDGYSRPNCLETEGSGFESWFGHLSYVIGLIS